MDGIFLRLLNISITAGWLVLAIVLLRLILKKAPRGLVCALWGLVAVRLICPFSIDAPWSLIPSAETVPPRIVRSNSPTIQSGVSFLNDRVNPVISQALAPERFETERPFLEIVFTVAGILWLVGVVAMLAYAAVSFLRVRRRVQVSMPAKEGVWLCDGIDTPFIFGVIRPRIYLPSSMDEEAVAYVLLHERTHLRRRDHWWKPLGYLLLTIYWFNPLMWLAYSLFCRDMELACDGRVIRQMEGADKKAYTATLLTCSTPRKGVAACPLAFGEVAVKQRIKAVLRHKKPALWLTLTAAVACVAVAVCFLTNPPAKYSDAELLAMVDEIARPSFSSYPFDYMPQYDEILSCGEDTVDCFVRELGTTYNFGYREYVMAYTCAEITGIGYYAQDGISLSPEEWLMLYDEKLGTEAKARQQLRQELIGLVEEIAHGENAPLFSSHSYDYIQANREAYNEILTYGDDAVECFVAELRAGDYGLGGCIMATACQDITGIGEGEMWNSGRDWLAIYERETQ
ncbi:MAG: hypothetical protein J6R77_03375 [Clostridia bacterium]|nr:hypothetical protein [Clostridia bacterium]